MNHHASWLFAALYLSEGWYERWRTTGSLHAKARALVLFDRVINCQIDILERKT